ncbi:MAG: PLP-dependent aminotransferase family protein [Lautropia sp.]
MPAGTAPPDWLPRIAAGDGPIYRQIAKALANDIRAGVLGPGMLLPPHRDLAAVLGVTVSTVTKAYKEVARLNLVTAHARGGTRVIRRTAAVPGWGGTRHHDPAMVDLASNSVGTDRYLLELATALPSLSSSARFGDLQEYSPVAGHPHYREVVSGWLAERGVQTRSDRIVITGGAHQALAAILAALAQDAVTLIAEELTYAPLQPLARSLRLRLEPVAMDADGLDPDDLERVCRRVRRPALFVTPNLNNPTTATLAPARRRAIVRTARRHDVRIVEDDVFALLAERPLPPFAAMAPERVFHFSSFAKAVAPGLRMGFACAPDPELADRVSSAVGLSTRMAPPLDAELACQWLADGTLERVVNANRTELAARVALARRVLDRFALRSGRFGPHLWLSLPPGLDEDTAVRSAAAAGVLVLPSREFSIRGTACHALRLTLTAPRTREALGRGLERLRDAIG